MKIFKKIFSVTNQNNKKVIQILGIKINISKFYFQHIRKFRNNKPTIALQLNSMDKGGLEEVVLQIASGKELRQKFNVVIICEYSNKGYLSGIAQKMGIPVYSFFNKKTYIQKLIKILNIKLVHFHYNMSGIEVYKANNVKTLYTIHNNYIWFDTCGVNERNKSYDYIDKFISVSGQVREFFCEKFSIPEYKVDVIPNGIEYIDINSIPSISKQQLGFRESDFILINVASFNPIKYHFAQIQALSKLVIKYPDIKLLIVGNIPDKQYYEQITSMIKVLNIESNVKIIDYVPKHQVYSYLKMSDCFIMTSLSEGFSVAATEAMLMQKPLILTDIGGARDIINNSDIGIVVKHAFNNLQDLNMENIIKDNRDKIYHYNNVNEIIAAIENVYVNSAEWQIKAKEGNFKVKEYFNVERVQKDYLNRYLNMLES